MWKLFRGLSKSAVNYRNFSNNSAINENITRVQLLHKKTLLKVAGPDARPFLQGLMTNDIRHLEDEHNKSMFCVFLNTQGRILYDTIIYRGFSESEFLIECDSPCTEALVKHLSMYQVRRKVAINVETGLSIWILLDKPPSSISEDDETILTQDPRTIELGWRLITSQPHSKNLLKDVKHVEKDEYSNLRYTLGIGEGVDDLPPGTSFPLESNCDYLHGISFHKGCYLGQELTARTYHTGVTRKRLMPIDFQKPVDSSDFPKFGAKIVDSSGQNVGKFRGLAPNMLNGLALLRIEQVLTSPDLMLENQLAIKTHRPSWWPIEAPKDRSQLDKK